MTSLFWHAHPCTGIHSICEFWEPKHYCKNLFSFVFFARNARIFLIITTVHNFILSYLDVQTYLESAAQACWPDSHLYGITDYWFLIYNFLFRYSVSWTCLTYTPWWFCAMLLFHQRDNRESYLYRN